MRFEDERYVRLYTRDSATWKMLPWQSKALLPLLMRKLDRVGLADVGDDGLEGIAALIDMPLELVEAGMPALLKRSVFTLAGGRLLMPNFLPAQEAKASDKLRAKEHRERVRARALPSSPDDPRTIVTHRDGDDTHRDDPSRCVTNRHAESHAVTGHHTASHGVTPCCAVLSRTETETEVELDSTALSLDGIEPQTEKPRGCPVAPANVAGAADPAAAQLALTDGALDSPARPSAVERVFAHWQTTLGKERAKLDPKRRKCIEAALKSHGIETCFAAIDGCAASPFHQGENDRHTRFDDLTLILRDAKHIEEFADLAGEAQPAAPQRPLHLVRPEAPVVLKPEDRFDPATARKAREELEAMAATMRGRASGDYGG